MFHRPRVHRHPRSKYWQAVIHVFDPPTGQWLLRSQTTKATDRASALSIAREFQKVANAASGHGLHANWTRETVLDACNAILRLSGVPEVIDCPTFQDYAQTWLSGRTTPQYRAYVAMLSDWLPEPMPMSKIDVAMLTRWRDDMTEQGRSPMTLQLAKGLLNRIFTRAVAEGFIHHNPASLLELSAIPNAPRETFTLAELQTLLAYLLKEGLDDWHTLVLAGLCTAQRMRDCAKMMWSQIEGGVWSCRQSKSARTNKLGKLVRVPLVDPLAEKLQRLRVESRSLYVMPELHTAKPNMSSLFAGHLEAAGIDLAPTKANGAKATARNRLSFHCLRHTTNSLMANAGISTDIRQAILGHADARINERYTHMDDAVNADGLAAALRRLAL